jgi:hypothetical protein
VCLRDLFPRSLATHFVLLKPKWSLFFLHLHLCLCLWLGSALCMVFVFALFSATMVTVFSYLQESELRLAELCGRESATPYMAKSINSRIH